jgi:hypothetical protein
VHEHVRLLAAVLEQTEQTIIRVFHQDAARIAELRARDVRAGRGEPLDREVARLY